MACNDTNGRGEQTAVPVKKPWASPEIHDQSVQSLTETKGNLNPTEASPTTGS